MANVVREDAIAIAPAINAERWTCPVVEETFTQFPTGLRLREPETVLEAQKSKGLLQRIPPCETPTVDIVKKE